MSICSFLGTLRIETSEVSLVGDQEKDGLKQLWEASRYMSGNSGNPWRVLQGNSDTSLGKR